MGLLNIISNKEKIGGLELSDNQIKFSLLKKNGQNLEVVVLANIELTKEDGSENLLKNESLFVSKLKQLTSKHKINYIVLSIPSDLTFAKIYPFPSIMPDEKIDDSVKLIAEFQLPQKPADIYWDFTKHENKKDNKSEKVALVSFTKRVLIDKLIANTRKAGLNIVAVESKAISLARAIKQKPEEIILTIERNNFFTSFYVIKDNNLIFLQSLANEKIINNLAAEIKRLDNYFEWLDQKISGLFLIGNFKNKETDNLPIKIIAPELNKQIKTDKIDSSSFIVLGAALRGTLERKNDTAISLMAVGTEEAYQEARANSTVDFIIGATTALAIFFVIAFYSVWVLIAMTQNGFNEQIISFNNNATANPNTLSEQAQSFNKIIGQTSLLLNEDLAWSRVVTEIRSKVNPGITIKGLSLTGAESVLSLNGMAKNRDDINIFRQSLESSELLSNVNIPLENLGKKGDIPFTATFEIKNQELIHN